ncbi:BnaA05g35720D [Brassica napus]|uniref:BnaA05g35720D protein n=1 Tax=Brassica napus TaxID=3708 RepID=A0A078J9C6_BRANA|nr:BnaA05g35720D [Brassica napus]
MSWRTIECEDVKLT